MMGYTIVEDPPKRSKTKRVEKGKEKKTPSRSSQRLIGDG
jgi:hypothetical protein